MHANPPPTAAHATASACASQAFLSDARHVLDAPDASSADELGALLPTLSEFLGGCATAVLSAEQRAFVSAFAQAAAARLLRTASVLHTDVGALLLACRRLLECCLTSLEQACADAASPAALDTAKRADTMMSAHRSLAAIVALCTDAEPDADALAAPLADAHAELASLPTPRFDELIALPGLQVALTRRHATLPTERPAPPAAPAPPANTPAGGGVAAATAAALASNSSQADVFAEALALIAPTSTIVPEVAFYQYGMAASEGLAAGTAAGAAGVGAPAEAWDARVLARDVRRQTAEALLASPTLGARRLTSCCVRLLEPLELRQHLLRQAPVGAASVGGAAIGSGVSTALATALDVHVAAAVPALDLAAGCLQLLLALPAPTLTAGASARLSGGSELLRLLAVLLSIFTLSANLPTGSGAAATQPLATATMLSLVQSRQLLPRLLLLLRREVAQPVWHANALLGAAVALAWALGASVPLATLFGAPLEPTGLDAWRSLQAALAPSGATAAASASVAGAAAAAASTTAAPLAVNASAVELMLSVLTALLRDPAPAAPAVPPLAAGASRGSMGALPAAGGIPSSGGAGAAVSVRLAGGFVLHTERAYTATERVDLLFALPGSTMLDTLIGLLLAACLRDAPDSGTPPPPPPPPLAVAPSAAAPTLLDALLASSLPSSAVMGGSGGGCLNSAGSLNAIPGSLGGGAGAPWVQLALVDFLHHALHGGSFFAPSLLQQLRLALATRHLRAFVLLLQFGAHSMPPKGRPLQRLRSLGQLLGERQLLTDALQLHLLRSAMQTAQWPTPAATPTDSSAHGWPLTLPPEPLRFYTRMMLARLRQRAATAAVEGAPSNDDPLVLEVLEGALTSLRVCAVDGGKEGAAPAAAASASPPQPSLLSLPHSQLLLLLWHSVSDAARADLMAATTASLCAAVDAATTRAAAVAPTDSAAGAAPLSPTQ